MVESDGSLKEGSIQEGSLKEGSVKEGSIQERSLKEGPRMNLKRTISSLREVSMRRSMKRSCGIEHRSVSHCMLCFFTQIHIDIVYVHGTGVLLSLNIK